MTKKLGLVATLAFLSAPPLFPADSAPPPKPAATLDRVVVIGYPPPRPRLRMNPHYPMAAKRRWEEGCVVLRFTVRPDGKTDDFAILESKPPGVFEKSVIGAVYHWVYEPAAEARTVVEHFQFRNLSLATQPVYSVRSAWQVPIGFDAAGNRRYRLDTVLQGYQPPKCKAG